MLLYIAIDLENLKWEHSWLEFFSKKVFESNLLVNKSSRAIKCPNEPIVRGDGQFPRNIFERDIQIFDAMTSSLDTKMTIKLYPS